MKVLAMHVFVTAAAVIGFIANYEVTRELMILLVW